MWNLYCDYWRPFGELLTNMEREGMMVDRCAKCALMKAHCILDRDCLGGIKFEEIAFEDPCMTICYSIS